MLTLFSLFFFSLFLFPRAPTSALSISSCWLFAVVVIIVVVFPLYSFNFFLLSLCHSRCHSRAEHFKGIFRSCAVPPPRFLSHCCFLSLFSEEVIAAQSTFVTFSMNCCCLNGCFIKLHKLVYARGAHHTKNSNFFSWQQQQVTAAVLLLYVYLLMLFTFSTFFCGIFSRFWADVISLTLPLWSVCVVDSSFAQV